MTVQGSTRAAALVAAAVAGLLALGPASRAGAFRAHVHNQHKAVAAPFCYTPFGYYATSWRPWPAAPCAAPAPVAPAPDYLAVPEKMPPPESDNPAARLAPPASVGPAATVLPPYPVVQPASTMTR